MTDLRIEKLAHLLVNYSVAVRPGDRVMLDGDTLAEPLLKEVYAKVLQAGGHPLVMARIPGADELLFRYASDEQLKHVPEPLKLAMQTYDVRISILAEENTRALSSVDPAKQVLRAQSRMELMKTFLQRAAAGELRWTLTMFPNNACAQDAEMSLTEYEDFVYGACLPDMEDPVGYWQRFSAWQQKIVDWLKGRERVHVTGPETDLHLSIAGRIFQNCDGHENMPDGEVFTGPVEDSVEGHVYFSYPAIYRGREVTGVRLWFEGGRVVKASADKNEDFLLKTLDTDEGSRRVGEFAIGTNEGITRFTREILFDEKIGGSFHMALGAGYPETGSKNESAIHWDMICDLRGGGEIRVDDELLYKDGRFVIEF
jgi:aminopeptidase